MSLRATYLQRVGGRKAAIIDAYDSAVIRWYCRIRFIIMNVEILEEIEHRIPAGARIIDAGCGFGLFSLYLAASDERRRVHGFDLSSSRIDAARRAARRLHIPNVPSFTQDDVTRQQVDRGHDAIILLDLMHHITREQGENVIRWAHDSLTHDGVLVIKDVSRHPRWKMLFTWVLDKLMDPRRPVSYYSETDMHALLNRSGFQVEVGRLPDILPYPHVIYTCRKLGADQA